MKAEKGKIVRFWATRYKRDKRGRLVDALDRSGGFWTLGVVLSVGPEWITLLEVGRLSTWSVRRSEERIAIKPTIGETDPGRLARMIKRKAKEFRNTVRDDGRKGIKHAENDVKTALELLEGQTT